MADGREDCGVRRLLIRLLDSVRPLHKMVQIEVGRLAMDAPLAQVRAKAALARPGRVFAEPPTLNFAQPRYVRPAGCLAAVREPPNVKRMRLHRFAPKLVDLHFGLKTCSNV
jgi:hypothetical protein